METLKLVNHRNILSIFIFGNTTTKTLTNAELTFLWEPQREERF